MVEGLVLESSLLLTPVSIYAWDADVRAWAKTHRSEIADVFFGAVNNLGDGKYHLIAWGGLSLAGYLLKNDEIYDFGKWGTASFVATGVATVALKAAIGRARPYLNEGPTAFQPFTLKDDYNSLPSGHTSVAFSTAGYVFARTGNPAIRWGSIALATSVGLARIYKDRHWLSDVIMGASLGFSIGYYMGRWSKASSYRAQER